MIKYTWGVICDWADEAEWLPWAIRGRIYHMDEWLTWRKQRSGVTSTPCDSGNKIALRVEGDVDDGSDMYVRTEVTWHMFESEEELAMYLRKSIKYESGLPPKLRNVEEFCQQFGFEVYERKY
jgi:hypothetical protein|tara:strand:+ start:69 stop:437 length:369 start_codon:yes stop_codon:yes gene_type:complete